MELEVGNILGDYEVVGILGAGGMGKVYKVRNVISDRTEAMKILLPDLVGMADLADRFLREIKLLASLEHPNIARLLTAVRTDNQLLMVMEFIDGETLDQTLRRGPLPVVQALDYIGQVLAALEFAHAHGVVHRDIKPANMILTRQGVVKLMDFGIAKASADHKLTVTGTTMGSVYYMSPEQIQGSGTLDARADLYSVGVALYELVTGKRPFDGGSQYSIMAAHLEKAPPPPISLDPRLPQELNDVILMSVAKAPDARFQTAAAFRNALLGVAAGFQAVTAPAAAPMPVPAVPVAPAVPTARTASSSKRWMWMTAGGLAVAAAIVIGIELAPGHPTQAATSSQQASAISTPTTTPTTTPPASASAAPVIEAAKVPESPPPVMTAAADATPRVKAAAVAPAVSLPPAVQPSASPQTPAASTVVSTPSPGPSRAEMNQARTRVAQLQVRATAIHDSLGNLKNSMQAQGLSINARFSQPEGLMDTYLRSANEAFNQSDLASAKDFGDKAERQIEILEKLLNM